jgi:hypothetical protein
LDFADLIQNSKVHFLYGKIWDKRAHKAEYRYWLKDSILID